MSFSQPAELSKKSSGKNEFKLVPEAMSEKSAGTLPTLLLVEDDFDDQQFIKRAVRGSAFELNLNICEHGEQALSYVQAEGGQYSVETAPVPVLVLLDLKLPRVPGLEVLEMMRKDPGYRSVPIAVLSGSTSVSDVEKAWDLGCSSFLAKPSNPAGYLELINTLCAYWMSNFQNYPTRPNYR